MGSQSVALMTRPASESATHRQTIQPGVPNKSGSSGISGSLPCILSGLDMALEQAMEAACSADTASV